MTLPSERATRGFLLRTELHSGREVRLLRRELRHAVGAVAVDPARSDDFVLAVNEAVANVFRHAYPAHGVGVCRVSLVRQPGALVAVIEDDGDGFDPRLGYETTATVESGRGFTIIRSLVDELVCDVTDSGGGHVELRLDLD